MFGWVGLLLRAGYYFGHIIGVSNFNFDWRTGRVFTTTGSTLYAIASNVLFVMLSGFIIFYIIPSAKEKMLYDYVINIANMMRITAVLGTLLNRLRHQSQIIILARDALRLCLASPDLIRVYRWRIFSKFVIGFFQLVFPLGIIALRDAKASLELGIELWIVTMIHLSIAQHYMVMLCVRAQYHLLNTELRQVVDESKNLSYNPPRIGAFMTRCCSLADQLENIAKLQSHLQSIVRHLNEVFGIQLVLMYWDYYASTVIVTYITYSIVKHGLRKIEYSQRDLIMSYTWSFFFYADAFLNLFIGLQVQDDHNDLIRLLEERTLFASGLDARLEQSFESLQLQLLRNPLKVDVLKLFPVTRNSMWAMFGSIILQSLCLVQYDMENVGRY